MHTLEIKNVELFHLLKKHNNLNKDLRKEEVLNDLVAIYDLKDKKIIQALKEKLSKCFYSNFTARYDKLSSGNKNYKSFEILNKDWLDRFFVFQYECNTNSTKAPEISIELLRDVDKNSRPGRPSLAYNESAKKTKEMKLVNLSRQISSEECLALAKKKLKLDKNLNGAKLIDVIVDKDLADKLFQTHNHPPTNFSTEEALSLLVEARLTKKSYTVMRLATKSLGHDIFPLYDMIREEKKKTYPDNIAVSENKCEVPLQDLLNHTIKRLMNYLSMEFSNEERLILCVKYGFDGTNAKCYNQRADSIETFTDNIFCVSLLPIQLKNEDTGAIYWENPRPSSTRFCRPIKISFEKETDELCRTEEYLLKQQIDNLQPLQVSGCSIETKMLLTMIDGKVCSALNETSSQTCFICKATISKFNDITFLEKRNINEEALKYGFSVLHAYIRFMELVLHISYRDCDNLRKWRLNKELQVEAKNRKHIIQNGLRTELGILVDAPTSGSGNTNNGNVARTFFNNVEVVSRITGFDEELLKRFKLILSVISCHDEVDTEAFRQYCRATALRYILKYNWYYMPTSLHVILIHGHTVMKHHLLPMGMLSEEAQEANHKYVKRYREGFARKHSRIATNTDIFHRLFLCSDPLISLSRKLPDARKEEPSAEMKQLLKKKDDD